MRYNSVDVIFMYSVMSYPRCNAYFAAKVSHKAFHKLCTLREKE